MLRSIVQMSYLLFVTNITFIIFTCFNSVLLSDKRRLFLTSACISFMMVFCNCGVYMLENTENHHFLLKLFLAVSYSISGPVMIPFIKLTSVLKKKVSILITALASGNAALSFLSIVNGCVFSINDAGEIKYGALIAVSYILTFFYLCILIYSSLIKYRLGFKSESYFLIWLAASTTAAVIMNFIFGFKFLISGMAVMSSVFYYIFFATQTLTRDALTNALNRHSFYKDIQVLKKKDMIIVSMDLNGLKQINDTLGHDEGDKAILAVSQTTFELLPEKCRFYRMGGDEFQILYPGADVKSVADICSQIKEQIKAKGYGVAVGFKEYVKDTDFDEALRKADELMYEDKIRMKKEIAVMKKEAV